MKTQLTPRDWQQLSDFLDNQLNPREKADLEKRMLERADLRAGFEELNQTRAVLRAAPHRRAPRNFTLKPEMALARRKVWRGWVPTFSFASVATALVAGVMLLGQMLPMRSVVPMMAAAPEAAPLEAPAQATPMIITWGDQAPAGMGSGGGYGGGGPETAPDLAAGKAAEPTPEVMPTDLPAEPRPEPTQEALALAPSAVQESTESENLILGIAPEEEQGLARTPETTISETQHEMQTIDWRSWLTGGLFGVAVLFAVLAIRMRRR